MTPSSNRTTESAIVLLADYENLVRWSLRERLQAEGYIVQEATTGAQAIHQAVDADVVVLDSRLPDLDGLEVLRRLRQTVPETPVILMGALSTTETAVAAMRQGAFQCVRKPFDLDEVSAIVEKAVETSRLRREVRALRAALDDEPPADGADPSGATLFKLPAGGANLEEVERQLLVQALQRASWNQTRAGALLGINRDQVRYRIEKFSLTAPVSRTSLMGSPAR